MTNIQEKPKMIGTPEARDMIERLMGPVTLPTVIGWCKQYNLGVKIGGRWYLYEDRLQQFLEQGKEENDEKKKAKK
jgi:hypothetical protein